MSGRDEEIRRQRILQNERSSREDNAETRDQVLPGGGAPDRVVFECECGDADCESEVRLTLDEYRELRRHPLRFAVAPGHVYEDTERVVARADGYEVVEKIATS
jgi:hypothetical protein